MVYGVGLPPDFLVSLALDLINAVGLSGHAQLLCRSTFLEEKQLHLGVQLRSLLCI